MLIRYKISQMCAVFILFFFVSGCFADSYEDQNNLREKIKKVVSIRSIHGLNYEFAVALVKLSTNTVPIMIEMLNNPEEEVHWSNITFYLGMMRDERAVDPLIDFIEKGIRRDEIISNDFESAITWAVTSVGAIGTDKGLDYLISIIEDKNFKDIVKCRYDNYNSVEIVRQLKVHSIWGLGDSGKPSALQKLKELQTKEAYREFFPDIRQAIRSYNNLIQYGIEDIYGSIYDSGVLMSDDERREFRRKQKAEWDKEGVTVEHFMRPKPTNKKMIEK